MGGPPGLDPATGPLEDLVAHPRHRAVAVAGPPDRRANRSWTASWPASQRWNATTRTYPTDMDSHDPGLAQVWAVSGRSAAARRNCRTVTGRRRWRSVPVVVRHPSTITGVWARRSNRAHNVLPLCPVTATTGGRPSADPARVAGRSSLALAHQSRRMLCRSCRLGRAATQ